MTLAVWPTELNQNFLRDGFTSSRNDRRIEAQPSRGRTWMRAGSSKNGGRPLVGAIYEPTENLARFWRFWEEELSEGVLPFRIRDQQIDGSELAGGVTFGAGGFDSGFDSGFETGPAFSGSLDLTDGAGNTILVTAYCICRFVSVSEEMPVPNANDYWQIPASLLVLRG